MFLGGSLGITWVLVVLWEVQVVIEMILPVFRMLLCWRLNGIQKRMGWLWLLWSYKGIKGWTWKLSGCWGGSCNPFGVYSGQLGDWVEPIANWVDFYWGSRHFLELVVCSWGQGVRQNSPPPSPKHQMMITKGLSFGGMVFIPAVELRDLYNPWQRTLQLLLLLEAHGRQHY